MGNVVRSKTTRGEGLVPPLGSGRGVGKLTVPIRCAKPQLVLFSHLVVPAAAGMSDWDENVLRRLSSAPANPSIRLSGEEPARTAGACPGPRHSRFTPIAPSGSPSDVNNPGSSFARGRAGPGTRMHQLRAHPTPKLCYTPSSTHVRTGDAIVNAVSSVAIERQTAEIPRSSGPIATQPVSLDSPACNPDPSGSNLWALLIALASNCAGPCRKLSTRFWQTRICKTNGPAHARPVRSPTENHFLQNKCAARARKHGFWKDEWWSLYPASASCRVSTLPRNTSVSISVSCID